MTKLNRILNSRDLDPKVIECEEDDRGMGTAEKTSSLDEPLDPAIHRETSKSTVSEPGASHFWAISYDNLSRNPQLLSSQPFLSTGSLAPFQNPYHSMSAGTFGLAPLLSSLQDRSIYSASASLPTQRFGSMEAFSNARDVARTEISPNFDNIISASFNASDLHQSNTQTRSHENLIGNYTNMSSASVNEEGGTSSSVGSPKKRKRRRYSEINRVFVCGYKVSIVWL